MAGDLSPLRCRMAARVLLAYLKRQEAARDQTRDTLERLLRAGREAALRPAGRKR